MENLSTLAVTLLELYRENDIKPNKRSNNCRVYRIKYKVQDSKRYIFLVKCKESWSSPDGHIVSIYFEDKGNKVNRRNIIPLNSNIRTRCHCPAFVYWGSAYNATINKYILDKKENRPPDIRDPFRVNKVCKHIVAVTKSLSHKNFKALQRGRIYSSINMLDFADISNLPEVSIQETLSVISQYIKENNIRTDNCIDFDNFESYLLNIGMII